MDVNLELFGMARHLAQEKMVELHLPEGAQVKELIAELAKLHPELVGTVIDVGCHTLIEPSIINIDGRNSVGDNCYRLKEGEPVCLMFVAAGG